MRRMWQKESRKLISYLFYLYNELLKSHSLNTPGAENEWLTGTDQVRTCRKADCEDQGWGPLWLQAFILKSKAQPYSRYFRCLSGGSWRCAVREAPGRRNGRWEHFVYLFFLPVHLFTWPSVCSCVSVRLQSLVADRSHPSVTSWTRRGSSAKSLSW